MEDMKKENLSLQRSAMELREEVAQLRSERGTDHERLLDTEWRSMRDNLLFHGVPEEKDESSVEYTLRGFLSKEMKVDGDKYDFSRVHRMGARKPGKPRAIVAKFERFKEREEVKYSARVLAGTHFGVNEQVPKEWADRRKKLMPKMREAKAQGKKTKFVKDKLLVEGRFVSFPVGQAMEVTNIV